MISALFVLILPNSNRILSSRERKFEQFEFFGVSGILVLCAVACFQTRPDTQHGHSTAQGHTAQSYYSFISNVVVSSMIHDNMYVYLTARPKVPGETVSDFYLF